MLVNRVATRVRRLSVFVTFLLLGVAPGALAASFSVPNNTTDNTPKTLAGVETGAVGTNATLSSNAATPTVTWTGSTGAGPALTNSGTIQNIFNTGAASGRAIDMNFTASSSSFTLTNNTGASITSGNDVFRINKPIGTGTLTVNNSGTMSSTGVNGNTNGQAIDFNANTSTTGSVIINNFATGIMSSADADGLRPGNNVTINNYGSISGNTTGDTGNDGIDFQDPGKSGTINNFGSTSTITGARHAITAKEAITIYNEGTITGQAGSGLNIDTITNSPVMSVTNAAAGKIIGNAVGGADADGIDIDRLANIDNSGTIQAVGLSSSPNLNEAIAIGGGSITNHVGGIIASDQRAITVDDSNLGNAFGQTTIINEGTIKGVNGEAISITSTFADTLTNKGTINGSVSMGAGDNTVTLYTGSSTGALNGGAGNDTLRLAGTGASTLGAVSNIETLKVDGGQWTVNNAQSYTQGGAIAFGSTLRVDHTTVAFGGTFIVTGALSSDPSTLIFNDLSIDPTGFLSAVSGDLYQVGGNFLNHSTQNIQWDTSGALLDFAGLAGTSHNLLLTGKDRGAFPVGYVQNFSWDELIIDAGNELVLGAGALNAGALYITSILGAVLTGDEVTNIIGNGFNIYYDPGDVANAYLGGRTFRLLNGGVLAAAVPEVSSIALLLSGLGVVFLFRRRRSDGATAS